MKVKINTGFTAKVQAAQFNPIEQTDSIEIEIEVKDEKEMLKKYESLQKTIRNKVLEGAMQGVKEFKEKRAQLLSEIEGE
jgi:hypothetical protein